MTRKYKATLTIPRDKWLDGTWVDATGHEEAMVYGSRMCCLAHAAVAAGVSKRACSQVRVPPALPERCLQKLGSGPFEWLTDESYCEAAVLINDNTFDERTDRERELIALFAKHGIRLRFTGKDPEVEKAKE